jgi:hypothetical protein
MERDPLLTGPSFETPFWRTAPQDEKWLEVMFLVLL